MTRIEQLRQIVERHQAAKVDGYMVDATTAHMLVTWPWSTSAGSR